MKALILLLAQGLGSGRAPRAPGTFGSMVGLAWAGLLLLPGSAWVFVGGTVAGVAAAVWICGRAEQLLGAHDPGSVVLDEIVAMPICFAVLLAASSAQAGFPEAARFLRDSPWWLVPAVFVAFRFFDILKPWPVRQTQRLPGGWGVVADDVLAAVWVNALSLLVAA